MWHIESIDEADYGCEERLPGEPLMALVTLECEDGRRCQFEVADHWLNAQKLDVGDEWSEDIDAVDERETQILSQSRWMENYLDALEEMDEE